MKTKELNKYIKQRKFKTIFMQDRDALMRCYSGIRQKYVNDKNSIIRVDKDRNYFYIVNNGYLTYYCIK